MSERTGSALVRLKALNEAEVRQNWRQALEDVAKCLEGDPKEQAAALQCMCSLLIPATPPADCTALFIDIQEKVTQVFTSTAERILGLLASSTDPTRKNLPDIAKLCELVQQFIGSLLTCCEHIRANPPSSSSSHSLPVFLSTTFAATERVLHLCKEVETVYSWAFEPLAAQLGPLFKSTYSLLKVCVECLEASAEQSRVESNSIVQVLSRLQSVCSVVLHFDPSLMVLVWRGMGRLLCRVRQELPESWSIQPIITELCITMETKCAACVQCAPIAENEAPSAVFSKLLRVCRFLGTLVVKLTQEFQQSSFLFAEVLFNLLLNTHSLVPPSLGARTVWKAVWTELDANILVMREPLMSVLLESQLFLKALLDRENVKDGQQLAWALCLCSLLKLFSKLPEGLQDFVLETDSSLETHGVTSRLLDAVFTCVRMCYVELSLPVTIPGIMCNGQPQREVTLYEHICTHLCSLVACFPARHFPSLERVLLRNVLGTDFHCCLLASDTWAFLARWGTSEVAHTHTNLMTKLVLLLPASLSPSHLALCSLLRQMIHFLSPEQQAEFLHTYPPNSLESLKLWSRLNLKAFSEQLHSQICQQLAATSVHVLKNQLKSNSPCQVSLCLALWSLVSVYELPASSQLLQPTVHNMAMTLAMQVWDRAVRTSTESKLASALLTVSLHLIPLLLTQLQPQHTTHVFKSLCDLVTTPPPLSSSLSSTHFLSQCSSLQVAPGIQTHVLRFLTVSFQSLLSHPHWLAHHHAMEAFRTFAEITPYADSVEQCIPPGMNEVVINFLNKVPYHSDKFSQEAWLVQQLKERERMVREEERWGREDMEQHARELPMQTGGASEQECSESVRVLQRAWEGVERCRGRLSAGLLEEVHRLGQGMLDFASQGGTLASCSYR